MHLLFWLIYPTGVYPLIRALRANRITSLGHAVVWAVLAWVGWGGVTAMAAIWPESALAARYGGLCLIGCAGVAVLGARRPTLHAWNFVVAGLLAILLLPLAEGMLIAGELQLSPVRLVFLAAILSVSVLNYLPTRFAIASIFLGIGCALEFWALLASPGMDWTSIGDWLLGLAPWAALAAEARRPATTGPNRLWLDFRDRFGLVWGQRLREQFNRSMAHAGLACELGWNGLRSTAASSRTVSETQLTLCALMKRFGPPDAWEKESAETGEIRS